MTEYDPSLRTCVAPVPRSGDRSDQADAKRVPATDEPSGGSKVTVTDKGEVNGCFGASEARPGSVGILVTADGTIVCEAISDPGDVTVVQPGVFATSRQDDFLASIRDAAPTVDVQDIFVTSDGDFRTAGTAPAATTTKVQPGIFAAAPAEEARIVAQKLPANTWYDRDNRGWHTTHCPPKTARTFQLFFTPDAPDRSYRVYLVSPRIERTHAGHHMHLYPDGVLCLTTAVHRGVPTLDGAWAKAALWAASAAHVLDGKGPWPISQ